GGRAGSGGACASACRCGDGAAGDAEAGGVFVGGLGDRQQLAGGLGGGAVVFEDAAVGDGEGWLALARSRWSRGEAAVTARRCSVGVSEKPWGGRGGGGGGGWGGGAGGG